ncbi:transposase [Fimbriiglobus ruber]|uniref:Mobile element protein n=1 Tax=Fimbriiglobus ruber TaxID=1908690 RepID=A0A225DD90_9BACT|nr:transposase [Fimbriiglobus ruber]OWK34375.1 Mobile element protein [Fimbriiglobus ruber]
MIVHANKPLFAWDELQHSPTLATIRAALEAIPDAPLLHALQQRRHRGCDTYPVRVLWGVLLLAILLRHTTTEACLEELRRNAPLRLLIGIASEDAVPHGWNLTRFLAVLGQPEHLTLMRDLFDHMVQRLGLAVPDLGTHTAGDSTGLRGRLEPHAQRRAGEVADGLPQASGGRKEYKDDDGHVTKVVEWFGYKLHLLVDVRHEVVLAFDISDTKAGDNERIDALVDQAEANLPADRMKTLAYDKAADDIKVHEVLHDHDIKPVIQNRSCGPKDGEREKVIGGRVPLHVVHDEAGTVYCYDTTGPAPVRRAMSYAGHEKDRGTWKYRCPARVEGFACGSEAKCNEGKAYGMTVRVDQEIDLRRFPSIPRATPQFERLYKGRTAVERVNDRLKVFWGLDDGNVVGARRFCAHVSAVLLVHLACATLLAKAQRNEGSFGTLRLSPIAKKLEELVASEKATAKT